MTSDMAYEMVVVIAQAKADRVLRAVLATWKGPDKCSLSSPLSLDGFRYW